MAQTPTKGRIVHYTNRRRPKSDDTLPPGAAEALAGVSELELDSPDDHEAALIVGVNPDGSVDLVVEYRGGGRVPLEAVQYFDGAAGQLEARGLWSWPVQVR